MLGMADNLLEVGGGFFVKISKHREFYDFGEVIQVIDEQNTKNIHRIRLDEEDKALIRPLLIIILKKKAQKLSPEQQLMGALISVMVKKAQVVMEIRAENKMLTERILEIIQKEKGVPEEQQDHKETEQTPASTAVSQQEAIDDNDAILEVADEDVKMETPE